MASLSAAEYSEWMAFYGLDPWGEQRDDMRMARLAAATLAPHSRASIDANEFLLFPDAAHELPDDVDGRERAWMLKLSLSA